MAEHPLTDAEIREAVRDRYAAAAVTIAGGGGGCCGGDGCGGGSTALREDEREAFGSALYGEEDSAAVPAAAALASLGCGNPTAVAELLPGETVLDLGSGAGLDVLLSARRVGPAGFAYGLDMTDEML